MRRLFLAALVFAALAGAASASDVRDWSGTAANNTAAPPDGVPQTIKPSQVPGTLREIMAAVRRWFSHATAISSTGSANSQVLTYNPSVTACVTGDGYTFFAGHTNTGATTLTVGGCAAPVRLGGSALTGGEIVAGRAVMVFYDGSAFQLLSGGGGGGSGSGTFLLVDGGGDLVTDDGGNLVTP